jgi:uncharacterized membrane protein (UPF0127 family)
MMRSIGSLLVALLVVLPAAAAAGAGLPTRTLVIGGHRLTVEVAATPETRATGLMNRFSLQTDHGMLFVFEAPQPLSFWMKDTYVPLSIAFVDTRGRIVNIEDMRPQDESPHFSKGLALYAIEMRQGWFATKGIAAGDVVEGLAQK